MTSPSVPSEPQPSLGPEGEKELAAFGNWLRSQREIREISLDDIASATNIGKRYLTALEQGRIEVLPGPIFVRGFLRQYAGFTGLDADEVVNTFTAAQQADQDLEVPLPKRVRSSGPGRWGMGLLLVVAVAVLLALVVALSFFAERAQDDVTAEQELPPIAVPPAASGAPVAESSVALREVPQTALNVTLDFLDDCWVDAVIDDDRTLSEVRVQGESLQIDAVEKVVLSIDKVSAVRVEVNGEPLTIAPDVDSEGVEGLEIRIPESEAEPDAMVPAEPAPTEAAPPGELE